MWTNPHMCIFWPINLDGIVGWKSTNKYSPPKSSHFHFSCKADPYSTANLWTRITHILILYILYLIFFLQAATVVSQQQTRLKTHQNSLNSFADTQISSINTWQSDFIAQVRTTYQDDVDCNYSQYWLDWKYDSHRGWTARTENEGRGYQSKFSDGFRY